MKKLGVIGYGHAGSQHANAIGKGGIVAVCDIDFLKATEAANQFECKTYTSADEMLLAERNLDAVVISTPNGLHAEHCIKALQAGVDVICETPVCLTTAAIWQIIETAKFCRKNVWVIDRNFSNQAVLLENELATGGTITGFYLQHRYRQQANDWRNSMFPGGGILYTQLHSLFNMLIKLLGPVETAKGFVDSTETYFELEGEVNLLQAAGVVGTINWSDKNSTDQLQIFTENKTFLVDLNRTAGDARVGNTEELGGKNIYQSILGMPLTALSENLLTIGAIEKIYKNIRPALSSNN
ncbi:MAG: Gfo/Idh/MocA family oxidoreductase [Bacteroidota bacterium]